MCLFSFRYSLIVLGPLILPVTKIKLIYLCLMFVYMILYVWFFFSLLSENLLSILESDRSEDKQLYIQCLHFLSVVCSEEGKLQMKRSAEGTSVTMTTLMNLPLQSGEYFIAYMSKRGKILGKEVTIQHSSCVHSRIPIVSSPFGLSSKWPLQGGPKGSLL